MRYSRHGEGMTRIAIRLVVCSMVFRGSNIFTRLSTHSISNTNTAAIAMPPKKIPPLALAAVPIKQKRFKPSFLAPPLPTLPPLAPSSSSVGEPQPSQSQGGDEDIATLGKILESMMKVVRILPTLGKQKHRAEIIRWV